MTGLRGRLRIYGDIAAGALLSIRRGKEEIAGKTLEFIGTETIDDVVVSLTTNVGQLDVSVIGVDADPSPVLVILFSEDPAKWRPGYVQYAQMTASPKPSLQSNKSKTLGRWSLQNASHSNATWTLPDRRD